MHAELATAYAHDGPTVGMIKRTLFLKAFSGFSRLAAEDLVILAAIASEHLFQKGEALHEPGKPVARFHLVIDGKVQIYRKGRPTLVLGPRSTIGGLAALCRDPRGAHAVALEPTFTLEIDVEDMDEVFEDNFSILQSLIGTLASSLRDAQIKMGGAAMDLKHAVKPVSTKERLNLVDKMFIMRASNNFADASIEALSELARYAGEHRFRAGEALWRAGERADSTILIVEGTVSCTPPGLDGKAFKLHTGYYMGGLDAFAGKERWYDCVADTDVVALALPRNKLLDVLEDHPDMGIELLRNMARGVNGLMERQAELAAEQAAAAEAAPRATAQADP